MSAPRERGEAEKQWTTAEKNYLLAEIIKANYPPPTYLSNVVTQLRIQPNWEEIPMPPGRTLSSCRRAYDDLVRRPGSLITQSTFGTQTPSPSSAHLPVNLKRPYPFEGSFGRELLPKPPISSESGYGQPARGDQPLKKKRGRPTKAEVRAKAEAQSATRVSATLPEGPTTHPEGAAPSSAGSVAPSAVEAENASLQPPVELPRSSFPPSSRMLISSMVTPAERGIVSLSTPSSGKRKRARSTRSDSDYGPIAEAEAAPAPAPAPARPLEEYQSPYARPLREPQSLPRAVTTQREESEHGYEPPNTRESDAQAHETSRSEP